MASEDLICIADMFCTGGKAISAVPIGNGHINDTYVVDVRADGESGVRRYILQRINTDVFRDPEALMENAIKVTGHIGSRLSYVPCSDGGYCLNIPDLSGTSVAQNSCWRMMTYIEDSYSCETIDDPEVFREIGRAYGAFISALTDLPAETLAETIPGFHDTRQRYEALLRAIDEDAAGRRDRAQEEIRFALDHERDVDILGDAARKGLLPLRVTHNDTKINNVLLDSATGVAVCVIDLDTVMPGLAVNDFGDAIRSGASTGREDEEDLSRVGLDLEMYRSYARGFMEGFPGLTQAERKMLPTGAKVMALECGIRFLTDYLEGDRYFKTGYPEHNLVRSRAQFKLVRDIEDKWEALEECLL